MSTQETQDKVIALIKHIKAAPAHQFHGAPLATEWSFDPEADNVDFNSPNFVMFDQWWKDDTNQSKRICLRLQDLINFVLKYTHTTDNILIFDVDGEQVALTLFSLAPYVAFPSKPVESLVLDSATKDRLIKLIKRINAADAFKIGDSPLLLSSDWALAPQDVDLPQMDFTDPYEPLFDVSWEDAPGLGWDVTICVADLVGVVQDPAYDDTAEGFVFTDSNGSTGDVQLYKLVAC